MHSVRQSRKKRTCRRNIPNIKHTEQRPVGAAGDVALLHHALAPIAQNASICHLYWPLTSGSQRLIA